MITLKEAIKLTKLSENEICCLRNEGSSRYNVKIATREVRIS